MTTKNNGGNKGNGYRMAQRICALAAAFLAAWSIKGIFSTGWVIFAIVFLLACIPAALAAGAIGSFIGGMKGGKGKDVRHK